MLGKLLSALLIVSVLSSCAYQRALNEEKEAAKNPKATVNNSTTIESPQQGSSVTNMNAPPSGAAAASKMISPLTSY